MRKLTILILLLVCAALAWGGWWFVGARATEAGLSAWLDARRGEGWTAEAAALDTRGFPNRFDTTFEALELADPDTGVGWSAPWFQILSLSYRPTHVIAAWPDEQVLRLPGSTLAIAAPGMIGSVSLAATPSLPLSRLVIEAGEARIVSSRGWSAETTAAQVALRETPAAPGTETYDVALTVTGLRPDGDEIARLRDLAGLPETIETLSAELTVTFDKPWDRSAIEDRRPQPREIRVTALSARWGGLALAGSGRITVDETGSGTGVIDIEATNWRDIVALAEASGALPEARARLVRAALETLAALGGDPERLDVPFGLSGGLLRIGPVPVGPAPGFSLP